MRIPNKVVCLWSCLTAFTFIHTAVAQDYSAQPRGAGYGNRVAPANYAGSATLEDGSSDPYAGGQTYAPLAYQDEAAQVFPDPGVEVPPPSPPVMQEYPPPSVPPGTNYWPQTSPFDEPVMQRTYRQGGVWVNDSIYGERSYSFGLEYLRVGFNRPGTDLIGARNVYPRLADGLHYRAINASVFNDGHDFLSDGLRAKFIIANADTSSLELSAFWVGESNVQVEQDGRADPNDTSTLRARGFIGLDNGTNSGTEMLFDRDFKLQYKQQSFGADAIYAAMPMYESSGFKLRPTFGIKYLKIREQFDLHGESSNLFYLQSAIDGSPIPGSVAPNPFGNPAFASDLLTKTTSDLLGGEIGLRYEVGGRNFLLSGQSRFAVAANSEVIDLSGNNFGDGFVQGFPQPTPNDPKPAAFADHRATTHVSPIFSQDFNFKGKVFKHLPIFNDLPLFANADMLVGYNFVLVGGVARPTKVIDWRETPRIDLTHSRWYMQAATFGLQWEY